jgi:hypothetical protein
VDDIEQKIIDDFLSSGALEMVGIDEKTQQPMYKVTPKMKKINPLFYKEHEDNVHLETMGLWELGFLEIDVTEENPIVKLLPSAFDNQKINKLSTEQRFVLEDIKNILMNGKL